MLAKIGVKCHNKTQLFGYFLQPILLVYLAQRKQNNFIARSLSCDYFISKKNKVCCSFCETKLPQCFIELLDRFSVLLYSSLFGVREVNFYSNSRALNDLYEVNLPFYYREEFSKI